MALSIRNGRVEQLARELSQREKRSMTDVILSALEERARTSSQHALDESARILEVGARCAALPDLDTRSFDEIVGYDDRGAF